MNLVPRHRQPDGATADALAGSRATLLLAVAAPVLVLTVGLLLWFDRSVLRAHTLLLFGHLACLVIGLGAVLTVDYTAARDLLLRRSVVSAARLAGRLDVPIWAGYTGLVGTGLLLSPNWTNGTTLLKIALVLVVGVNGVYVIRLRRQLTQWPAEPPGYLVVRGVLSATVSQSAWWGATFIGFVHAQH